MDPWLVPVRFVHYGASLVLFGLVLFPFYAYPPDNRRDASRRALTISFWLSLLVLFSGLLWFIGVATSMTETAMSWETARFVLTDTSFGAVSQLRLGATMAAAGVLLVRLNVQAQVSETGSVMLPANLTRLRPCGALPAGTDRVQLERLAVSPAASSMISAVISSCRTIRSVANSVES